MISRSRHSPQYRGVITFPPPPPPPPTPLEVPASRLLNETEAETARCFPFASYIRDTIVETYG